MTLCIISLGDDVNIYIWGSEGFETMVKWSSYHDSFPSHPPILPGSPLSTVVYKRHSIHVLFPWLGPHCPWTSLWSHPSPFTDLCSNLFGAAFPDHAILNHSTPHSPTPPTPFSALFFSTALIVIQYSTHVAHLFYCLFFPSRTWAPWRHGVLI